MDEKDKNTKDTVGEIVRLKSQRLASATYLVSGFINDSDPIKWKLREQSLLIAKIASPLNVANSLTAIDQMVAYLDIALSLSQISEMNLSILKQEYQKLGETLRQGKELNLFGPVTESLPPVKRQLPPAKRVSLGRPASRDSGRGEQILSFIRRRGESSIKDIAAAVPGVSSKTVQRELSQLVSRGVLRREGDRRWSRYLAL